MTLHALAARLRSMAAVAAKGVGVAGTFVLLGALWAMLHEVEREQDEALALAEMDGAGTA